MNKVANAKVLSIAAIIILLFCIPLFLKNVYWLQILCFVCINILLASSLRTINLSGELSLGSGGFMLVGAFTSALVSMRLGLSVWLTMLLGGLLAALIALLLSYPILRTKGVYFSVLTLVVAEAIRLTMWYLPDISGGGFCLRGIPAPGAINFFGLATINFDKTIDFYYLFLIIGLICLVILFRLERALELKYRAIRQSDSLAEALGIGVMRYKIIVFVIGCFFAGIAGALFGHYIQMLSVDTNAKFGMLTSIYIVIYLLVGGSGSFFGPIIGATVLTIIPEISRPLKEYQPIVFGAIVIVCIFFLRQGLVSLPYYFRLWSRNIRSYLSGKTYYED